MIEQNRVEALSFRRCGDCGLQFTWSLLCPACLTLIPALTDLDRDDLDQLHLPNVGPTHLLVYWHFQDNPDQPMGGTDQ